MASAYIDTVSRMRDGYRILGILQGYQAVSPCSRFTVWGTVIKLVRIG